MKTWVNFGFIIIILCLHQETNSTIQQEQSIGQINVSVFTTNHTGFFERFWENTGLSAPEPGRVTIDYLGSRTELFNLAFIGALPFKGISYVRIHWLLDLISTNLSTCGNVFYDFSRLDKLISWLYDNSLRPWFELMGNPGNLFSSLGNNVSQTNQWRELIFAVAEHYKDKYGLDELEKWKFETWNEPDLKMYNILNFTLSGYLNYVTATRDGLKACSATLQLYGPAGVFKTKSNHPLCWGLLAFCENQMVQNNSCPIDAITFHKKGNRSAEEIVEGSLQLYREFKILFPHLSKLPISNDEADVLTGWWREEDWREDVRYASAVSQSVALFHKARKQLDIPLKYISNDNGFLNIPPAYFNQRTLLTRFIINTTNADCHDQFIRKPVYIVMAMLAYLGDMEVHTIIQPNNSKLSVIATCSNISTSQSWSCAVLLTLNSRLEINSSKTNLNINMILPKDQEVMYFTYLLDNSLVHPASVWRQAGKPDIPNKKLLKLMRKAEGPHRIHASKLQHDNLHLSLRITMPSIVLLHLCGHTHQPPGQVVLLPAMNVTYNEVLLLWKDINVGTKCIKTYEIEFCKGNCKTKIFRRINKKDVILLAFQYIAKSQSIWDTEATVGLFRARAVDYWGASWSVL